MSKRTFWLFGLHRTGTSSPWTGSNDDVMHVARYRALPSPGRTSRMNSNLRRFVDRPPEWAVVRNSLTSRRATTVAVPSCQPHPNPNMDRIVARQRREVT